MLDLSPETEALAHRLAETQRISVDEAVRRALEAQRRREASPDNRMSPEEIALRRAAIHQAVAEISALPILDQRPIDEIIDDLHS